MPIAPEDSEGEARAEAGVFSAHSSGRAPPHAAAIVLPVRLAITPNFDFSALNVQSRNVLCCTRRVFVACEGLTAVRARRYGLTAGVELGVAGRGLTHPCSWVTE